MFWGMDNFIANMSGPAFLFFYLCTIIIIFLVTGYFHRLADDHGSNAASLLSGKADPEKVAALMLGCRGVFDVMIFRLLDQKILVPHRSSALVVVQDETQYTRYWQTLTPLERKMVDYFKEPQLVDSAVYLAEAHYSAIEQRLQNSGLVCRSFSKSIVLAGLMLMSGLGIYKLVVALMKGHHNVLFLILMMCIAGGIYARKYGLIRRKINAPLDRVTFRGRRYLSSLSKSLGKIQTSKMRKGTELDNSDHLALIMVLYGIHRLPAENFNYLQSIFSHQTGYVVPLAANPGLTSGGCGSSSGCSSGCSGCGGCGGCG